MIQKKMGDSGISLNSSISYDEMDLSDDSDSNQSIYTTNTIIASPSTYSGPMHDTSPSTKTENYQSVMSNSSLSEQNFRASSTIS